MAARVIVFDLDDTLYPERRYACSGLRAAGAYAASAFGITRLADVSVDLFHHGRRGDVFQEALRRLGIVDSDGTIVSALVEAYRSHVPSLDLFPDVAEVLPRLQSLGRIAVLTDGYLPPQRLKVSALGLDRIANPIVYTEELGREHWKPSPTGFVRIESICGAAPQECVYVADNPRKDFVAPAERGWTTVRMRRLGTEHGPLEGQGEIQLTMSDFLELERWLLASRGRAV